MNRKDCTPNDTIKKIKKILKENNIKVKESPVINLNNKIFSVRLELKDIPRYWNKWEGHYKRICSSKCICRIHGKASK